MATKKKEGTPVTTKSGNSNKKNNDESESFIKKSRGAGRAWSSLSLGEKIKSKVEDIKKGIASRKAQRKARKRFSEEQGGRDNRTRSRERDKKYRDTKHAIERSVEDYSTTNANSCGVRGTNPVSGAVKIAVNELSNKLGK